LRIQRGEPARRETARIEPVLPVRPVRFSSERVGSEFLSPAVRTAQPARPTSCPTERARQSIRPRTAGAFFFGTSRVGGFFALVSVVPPTSGMKLAPRKGRLRVSIGSGPNRVEQPVEVHPFFAELWDTFPDKDFVVYDDSGRKEGPFLLYPQTKLWSEYLEGAALAKRGAKKAREELERIGQRLKTMRRRTDRYLCFVTLIGFLETATSVNWDAEAVVSWSGVDRKELVELVDIAKTVEFAKKSRAGTKK
jgi:hypothetical protein